MFTLISSLFTALVIWAQFVDFANNMLQLDFEFEMYVEEACVLFFGEGKALLYKFNQVEMN